MLTGCTKTYSSYYSQIALVYFQPFHRSSLEVRGTAEDYKKPIKRLILGGSGSSKVIDVDTTKMLVISAHCDSQHIHAYLQPFSQ